jgi:signal transduction histidine kinase/CheY-like chemotaxis protein
MESDNLAWLCAELGLPAVMESELGVVGNRAAVAAGCEEPPVSLEAGVASLLRLGDRGEQRDRDDGRSALGETLRDALARARAGEAVSCVVGGGLEFGSSQLRVIATPHGAGRAHVVVAPVGDASALELSRRASLVDVAAAVSHEVANAVGAIAGWAELGVGPAAGVSAEEALRLIGSCARAAQQAARNMLSVARGEVAEQEQEIDFSALASELLSLLSLTARQARVRLSTNVEPDLKVLGSRSQLFTVLWNLAKNAVEACAPNGTVSVLLSAAGAKLVLEVRDNGAGLHPDELARIFTPYYTTKATGTGLGLVLVQQAATSLGGEIAVQSSKGRGTTFRVTMPRLARHSNVVAARPAGSSAGSSAELAARVLVIDDDDALREMIATALSLRGADVVTAKGSEQACKLEGRFDIALIDMMLDDCRGDELLALLRRRDTVSAAMLVTGTVQKPRLVAGGEPDDWVRKPFEIGLLVERIQRTLDRHRMLSSVTAGRRR